MLNELLHLNDNACGLKGLLVPLAIDNSNAFNPCFVSEVLVLIAQVFLCCCFLELYKVYFKPSHGDFTPKSTGLAYYVRLNLVILHLIIFAILQNMAQDTASDRYGLVKAFYWIICTILVGILPLHVIEPLKSPIPNGALLLFWLCITLVEVILFYQDFFTNWKLVSSGDFSTAVSGLELLAIINSISIFISEYSWWKPTFELTTYYKRNDMTSELSKPNLIEGITYSWMNEMIVETYKNQTVTGFDLPNAPVELSAEKSTDQLLKYYFPSQENPSLVIPLIKAFGGIALVALAMETGDKILDYVQPQLLRLLIQFFGQEDAPLLQGALIALLMFIVTLFQNALFNQYALKIVELGLSCRSSLTCLIFQKSLRLSSESRANRTSGEIVNLMSVDVNRIQSISQNMSTLITAPLELVICVYSLWAILGKATLVGVLTMVFLIPINTSIVRYSRKLNKKQMKLKDKRTRIINEIISGIKSIKLYAWEKPMLAKLFESRNNKELKNLKRIRIVNQFGNFIWNIIPFLVSFGTFATYSLTEKKPLTSDIIFPALNLLDLLSNPLIQLPMVISSLIEASVAMGRIKEFLLCSEVDESLITRLSKSSATNTDSIDINGVSFMRNPLKYSDDETVNGNQFALKNIEFTAKKGELTCIVGRVGSGKSTFLESILGQLYAVNSKDWSKPPSIRIYGTTAYCPQSPWIMNASFKENITFGHRFDPDFYQRTVEACQLLPDLAILPDGDETQVGEKGISLSGGQKARLALARAVYSRADIYLLDDILSAVDSHVGKHIIDKVLSKNGLLATKTVVLCTNSISVLKYSDKLLLVEDGSIIETTSFKFVEPASHPKLFNLIEEFDKSDEDLEDSGTSSKVTSDIEEETEEVKDSDNDTSCTQSLRRASVETFHWNPLAKLLPNLRSGQLNETLQKGKVKWKVYGKYIKACSILGIASWFSLMILSSVISIASTYWLKHWAEKNAQNGSNDNALQYIAIYALLGFGSSLLLFTQGVVMWIYLSIKASKLIHDKMATRILKAPMVFFERTPIGRIMNRFTNDINKIDDIIPRIFSGFFRSSIRTFFILCVIGFAIPSFLIMIVAISFLYAYYQSYYVSGSRELKRLVSVSRSPIYGHLQESLTGVDTIRAFNQEDRFFFINNSNLDFNLKGLYMLGAVNRWLSVRLQFLGSIVVLSASVLSIYSLSTSRALSAGMAGFTMSYALQTTLSLNRMVRTSVEMESNVVAVERCLEYCDLQTEENLDDKSKFVIPPITWPSDGSISFNNYSTRYRKNLDLVLKNVTFKINPGEKIGVVGRTGAGKSSLAVALFRIIEAVSGNIDIDSINTSTLILNDLRKNLGIIPQDSQLFEDSLRLNLDPFDYFKDDEIWKALELAHLKDHILLIEFEGENKLNVPVMEGGSNFSLGQRQLMSLARVLLKMNLSKILVLDEATAAVDVQTDKIIQETIRSEFKDKTIITIAHRLETVMDSDKILTLDSGEVKEFDTPKKLLQDESSIFYSLCKKGGYI